MLLEPKVFTLLYFAGILLVAVFVSLMLMWRRKKRRLIWKENGRMG
jgi:hypothetical protein